MDEELQQIARYFGDLVKSGSHEDGTLLLYFRTPPSQALVDQVA